jgi:hypothetical protein
MKIKEKRRARRCVKKPSGKKLQAWRLEFN